MNEEFKNVSGNDMVEMQESDIVTEDNGLQVDIENLQVEKEYLQQELKTERENNQGLNNYCKELLGNIQILEKESMVLMRKVIMYQEAELQKYKEAAQ